MAQVTDPVLLKELAREGINPAEVDFDQDYAPHSRGKRHSPYAKFYRGLSGNARGKQWVVISGLPMVDADGVKCEPKWIQTGNTYHTKANVFDGLINDIPGRVTLTVKNDDAVGRKKNDRLVYISQIFLNGVEVPRPGAVLLPVDPLNPNYLENTIEWDYGICKRRLRQIEGHIAGSWVFPANPGGEVRIKYNQTGDYRLKLGRYATDADTEVVPASAFITDESGQPRQYPFTVSDSATYYPDASPESTSVDGVVARMGVAEAWATIRSGAGTTANDDGTLTWWGEPVNATPVAYRPTFGGSTWQNLERAILLFDTSGLPNDATISAATLSLYNRGGYNQSGIAGNKVDINIYSSTPASNTALVAADYGNLGSTAFSTTITYNNFIAAGDYNDFVLNASGRAAISLAGVSKFGARDPSHDVSGTSPTYSSNAIESLLFWSSEQGNGYKPKLVVTYTVPVTQTTQGKASLNAAKLMAAGAI